MAGEKRVEGRGAVAPGGEGLGEDVDEERDEPRGPRALPEEHERRKVHNGPQRVEDGAGQPPLEAPRVRGVRQAEGRCSRHPRPLPLLLHVLTGAAHAAAQLSTCCPAACDAENEAARARGGAPRRGHADLEERLERLEREEQRELVRLADAALRKHLGQQLDAARHLEARLGPSPRRHAPALCDRVPCQRPARPRVCDLRRGRRRWSVDLPEGSSATDICCDCQSHREGTCSNLHLRRALAVTRQSAQPLRPTQTSRDSG